MNKPRTSHTDPLNAPDFISTDAAPGEALEGRWCSVCKCWDVGLIITADGCRYRHRDEPDESFVLYHTDSAWGPGRNPEWNA